MGVENILIIVCVWHSNMPGQFGTETFKMVLERAKDLLTSLHMKVLEAEKIALQEEENKKQQALVLYQPSGKSNARSALAIGRKSGH